MPNTSVSLRRDQLIPFSKVVNEKEQLKKGGRTRRKKADVPLCEIAKNKCLKIVIPIFCPLSETFERLKIDLGLCKMNATARVTRGICRKNHPKYV
jgi:hypothetical protein